MRDAVGAGDQVAEPGLHAAEARAQRFADPLARDRVRQPHHDQGDGQQLANTVHP